MLYLRWLETSRRFADRVAIRDGGKAMTFREMNERLRLLPQAEGPVVARTGGTGFFFEVLRAWRDGQAVIPVEKAADEPSLKGPVGAGMALVKYTPGAAGIPRGIFFSGEAVAADGDRLVEAMEMNVDVPNLAVISLAHSYGFSNIVLPLVLRGVPVQMVEVPFPRVVEEAMRVHRRVMVAAVPSMWRAWQRAGILKGAPIAQAISAGAPLALDLEHIVYETSGLKIRNFYGASECGGISLDGLTKPRGEANDLGELLPGVAVTFDEAGHIGVSSDAVAEGYDVQRAGDRLGCGFYQTKDRGHLDADGHLHLDGTSGGAINVAGRKVSPAKIESVLMASGCVVSVKVYGIVSPDVERNEEIAVEIRLKSGVALEEVKRAAAVHLANWEMPRHWRESD